MYSVIRIFFLVIILAATTPSAFAKEDCEELADKITNQIAEGVSMEKLLRVMNERVDQTKRSEGYKAVLKKILKNITSIAYASYLLNSDLTKTHDEIFRVCEDYFEIIHIASQETKSPLSQRDFL